MHNCCVCVYGHLLNVRTIFSKDFFNIILCISYYYVFFLFFLGFLDINFQLLLYFLCFFSLFVFVSTSTAFYYLWCAVFLFDILLQGFQNCLMFTPDFFVLLLCWVVCCNSVIIKYALNLFALNKVSHLYLFI